MVVCIVQDICLFHLNCQIYLGRLLIGFYYFAFDSYRVCSDSPRLLLVLIICVFSLSSVSVGEFYWSFKKKKKGFASLFFSFPLFFSCFHYFLPSAFCKCIWSSFLRYELKLLIWNFSTFLMTAFSAINCPLITGLAVSHKCLVYCIFTFI